MDREAGGWRLENHSPEVETKMHSDSRREMRIYIKSRRWLSG